MFSKGHRFHGHSSLKRVYERGQNIRGSLLSLKFVKRDPSKPYRVAVVVSRKVSKSAVTRNRIRRRVYAQTRQLDDQITPGTDLVFTVYSDKVADLEAPQLQTRLNELLQKTYSK